MALTIEQIRSSSPNYEGYTDEEVAKHAEKIGIQLADKPAAEDEAGIIRSNVTIPLLKGINDASTPIAYGLGAMGAHEAANYLSDSHAKADEALTQRQSQQARDDAAKTFINDQGEYGGANLGTVAQSVFQSAPSTVAMMGPGAGLAKLATIASKGSGVGAAIAAKVGQVAETGPMGNALAEGIDTAIGSGAGFGAAEGMFSGAQNAEQTQHEIRNTDFNQLSQQPAYQEIYHNETDPGLSVEERHHQARELLAQKAANDVFADTSVKTGLISAATGGGVFGMIRKGALGKAAEAGAESTIGKIAKGFAVEAGQEAPQSYFEQRTQNQAKKDYADQNQEVGQGALNAGIEGGIAGGIMGAFGGHFSGHGAHPAAASEDKKPVLGLPAPPAMRSRDDHSPGSDQKIKYPDGSEVNADQRFYDLVDSGLNKAEARRQVTHELNGEIPIPDGTGLNHEDLTQGFIDRGYTEADAKNYIQHIESLPFKDRTLENILHPINVLKARDDHYAKQNESHQAEFDALSNSESTDEAEIQRQKDLAYHLHDQRRAQEKADQLREMEMHPDATPDQVKQYRKQRAIIEQQKRADADAIIQHLDKAFKQPELPTNQLGTKLAAALQQPNGGATKRANDGGNQEQPAGNSQAETVNPTVEPVAEINNEIQSTTDAAINPQPDVAVGINAPTQPNTVKDQAQASTDAGGTETLAQTDLAGQKPATDSATQEAALSPILTMSKDEYIVHKKREFKAQNPNATFKERVADFDRVASNYDAYLKAAQLTQGKTDEKANEETNGQSNGRKNRESTRQTRGSAGTQTGQAEVSNDNQKLHEGQNAAEEKATSTEAVEKYQWMRNKEGGQDFGNQEEIRPLTKEIFDRHVADKVSLSNFESYKAKYPEVTHIQVVKKHNSDIMYGRIGSIESLRPHESAVKKGWVIPVDNFDSEEAVKHGKTADSQAPKNPTVQPNPGTDSSGNGAAVGRSETRSEVSGKDKSKPRKNNLITPPSENDELKTAIGKLGGITRGISDRDGFSDYKGRKYTRLFNNGANSKTLDEMAELLRGYGFNVDGENSLIELLDRSLRGDGIYTAKGYEKQAELKRQEHLNDEQARFLHDFENRIDEHRISEEELESAIENFDDDFDETFSEGIKLEGKDAIDFLDDIFGIDDVNEGRNKATNETGAKENESQKTETGASDEVGYVPGPDDLLQGINAVGINKPKAKPNSTKSADLFVDSEEDQAALDARQGADDVSSAKDDKRNGNAQDGGELFPALGQADAVEESRKPESAETTKAKADLDAALGDLGQFFLENNVFTKKAVPGEFDDAKLMPIMARVMDAAIRLGYAKFKDAAKFTLDTIRGKFGDRAADSINIDHFGWSEASPGGMITNKGQSPGSTVAEITAALPKRVRNLVDAGKFKVVQSVEDLPDQLQNKGTFLQSILYHGSSAGEKITSIKKAGYGVFDGIFASNDDHVAKSHGDVVTKFNVDDNKILDDMEIAASYQELIDKIKDIYPDATESQIEDVLYPAIVEDKSVYNMDESEVLEATGAEDLAYASWNIQNSRGYIAGKLGYDAVSMNDEHGKSYFLPFGSNAKPINYSKLGGVQALYDSKSDKLYLVADMLDKNNLDAVLAHELFHRALSKDPATKAAYDRFVKGMEARFNLAKKGIGTEAEKAAAKRVIAAGTPVADQVEEFSAYLVTTHETAPTTLSGHVRKLIQDFVAAVRMVLVRNGLDMGFVKTLTPADLAAMSRYGEKVTKYRGLDSSRENNTEVSELLYSFGTRITNMRTQGNGILKKYLNDKNKDTAIYNFQDRFIDLKRQMDKIVKNGGVITEDMDPRLKEEVYHQGKAYRIEQFFNVQLKPILEALHKNKISLDKFQEFLHARHAPSRNAVMAGRNPNQAIIDQNLKNAEDALDILKQSSNSSRADLRDAAKEVSKWSNAKPFHGAEEERLSLSGMSNKESRDFISKLSTQELSSLTALGDKIDKINDETLDLLVHYGLETAASVQALKQQWQHYVPLHRDEAHADENNFGHPVGRGFSVRGTGMQNATGSNAEVTNILGHIMAAREQIITRGEKNNVTKALADMITAHPDADFATIDKMEVENKLNKDGLVESQVEPVFKRNTKDNVVMYRIAGKDHAIVFNEKSPENIRLAMSLKNLDGQALNAVEKFFSKGTRWLASVNTQYNLVFGIFNLMRDTQGMLLNLTSTPLHGQQKKVLSHVAQSLKVIYDIERGRSGVDPAMKAMYERFNKAGGTTGYNQMFEGIEERDKLLRDEIAKYGAGRVIRTKHWIGKALSDFNTVMENSTRLATFMVAVDSGLSDAKAASLAKNITVNFNRKGAKTTEIGAMYAFFNASMQGSARMIETLRGPQGKTILGGGVALGAALTILAISAMGADDWEKIPEFVRERSLIIPLGTDGKYLAIPMPLGFHIIPNIGRKFVESIMGSNRVTPLHRFAQLAGSVGSAFNPLGGTSFMETITPTLVDPAMALYANKDWTGRSIYKEDFDSTKPTPGFTRAKNTASSLSKSLAWFANSITGGTDYKQGVWSPTPDQIDFVIGQLTGGTGREIIHAQEVAAALVNNEEIPTNKLPIVGKLYGETKGNSVERSAFYDNLKLLNEHHAEVTGLRKEPGGAPKAIAYMRENPVAKLYPMAHDIHNQIDKMKDRHKRLEKSGASASSLRALDDQIAGRMKVLNDRVANALK